MNLHELVIYDTLAEDPIIKAYTAFLHASYSGELRKAYFDLIKHLLTVEMTFETYLFTKMIETSSPILERLSHKDYQAKALDIACLNNDLAILDQLIKSEAPSKVKEVDDNHHILGNIMSDTLATLQLQGYKDYFSPSFDPLEEPLDPKVYIELLQRYGTGEFANNNVYYINQMDELVPVEDFKPLSWDHIYDYEHQKEELKRNTKALVKGRPYHHALLVGASGTGKSSSVKAVVDLYSNEKLRLVQIYKSQLRSLPKVLKRLSKSVFKFVIFIDDLSFEVNEDDYKLLKSYIEGGIVNEATNIAFYVTSNRQHLIKEVRSDREGDIHLQDFIQEMTSLSRRFGLHLTFEKLQQKEYFEMVATMLDDEAMVYERQAMEVDARRWALRHSGMSGRIAMQYVKHLQMMASD